MNKMAISTIILLIPVLLTVGCNNPSGGSVSPSGMETPVISPEPGIITVFDEITITGADGSTVYYTTDGSDPDTASAVYSGPFTLPADTALQTVKAFAAMDGIADSAIATSDFMVYEKVADVTFADADGAVPDTRDIVLTTATAGATIRYTTDGTDPDETSDVYSAPFTMKSLSVESLTVKAYAILDGYSDSDITAANYTKAIAEAPVSDRADGETISNTMTVTLSSTTEGAVIYYTTDGTDPDPATSTVYAAPFTLPAGSETVRALTAAAGYTASGITTVNLTVEAQAEIPAADVDAGFIASGTVITLSTSSGLETIYYTTDGSDPADGGTVYTAPVTLTSSAVLRAYAAGDGYYPSAEVTRDYTVYAVVDTLTSDADALMASHDGSPVVRAGGSWYDLVSGAFTLRTAAAEPAGTLLDFAVDSAGTIHSAFLSGSDLVYWTSAAGTVATVSTAAVSLADAAVVADAAGNIRIAFAQDSDGTADEAVEAAFDSSGTLLYSSAYAVGDRATAIDAAVDSSDTLSIAVSEPKNTSEQTLIVSYDSDSDAWTTVMDWKNNTGAPALHYSGDDTLTMAYVNPRKNEFFFFDIATAAASAKMSVDITAAGDTRIAGNADGTFYGAAGGTAWFYDGTDITELPFGSGPYGVITGTAGSYVMDADGLTLYEIR